MTQEEIDNLFKTLRDIGCDQEESVVITLSVNKDDIPMTKIYSSGDRGELIALLKSMDFAILAEKMNVGFKL